MYDKSPDHVESGGYITLNVDGSKEFYSLLVIGRHDSDLSLPRSPRVEQPKFHKDSLKASLAQRCTNQQDTQQHIKICANMLYVTLPPPTHTHRHHHHPHHPNPHMWPKTRVGRLSPFLSPPFPVLSTHTCVTGTCF
jgi:hypothetical protein